ncbi:MAG: hypothetical protein H0U73_03150 [Tatlockia sp.]|nr:hypothetical protein [Tatlockia sp.]
MISAGDDHFLILTSEGKLFGKGDNQKGQLGLGQLIKHQDKFVPISLEGLEKDETFVRIGAGFDSSLALSSKDRVFGCGVNFFGQLGLGDIRSRYTFTLITIEGLGKDEIIADFCIKNHTLLLTSKGSLFGSGSNCSYQLGLSDNNNHNRSRFAPITIKDLEKEAFVKIGAGELNTFALSANGKLYGCGDNTFGQLGLGDKKKRPTLTEVTINGLKVNEIPESIYTGMYFVLIETSMGHWGCGENGNGQLGLGHTNDTTTFTPCLFLPHRSSVFENNQSHDEQNLSSGYRI